MGLYNPTQMTLDTFHYAGFASNFTISRRLTHNFYKIISVLKLLRLLMMLKVLHLLYTTYI